VLHEVSMVRQAAIDSMRTDAAGRYRFRVAAPDTGALYLVSSTRAGIAYFSQPLRLSPRASVTADSLTVYDTSATGTPVRVERRLLTIARARADGSRDVLEVLELRNPDLVTRIAADTTHPTWRGRLPAGAIQFQVGESDFSPQAVALHGDSILVFGPVQPGLSRQLSFSYVLPATANAVAIPVDQGIGELHLLIEDTTATLAAGVSLARSTEDIEGRKFRSYSSQSVPAGTPLLVRLPPGRPASERALPWLVGGMVAALVLGLGFALRRRPASSPTRQG